MVARRHEDHLLHVGREDRLLVPGRMVRQPPQPGRIVLALAQVEVEELEVQRGVDALGEEEATSVGRPVLGLEVVAGTFVDDSDVLEMRTAGIVDVGGDADVPIAAPGVGDEVPVEPGPHDPVAVR